MTPTRISRLISALSQVGLVMVASQKTGATNLKEFIEYAKKTDKVSMGTYAAGSTAHLIVVELNKQYGLNIEPVHYRGEAPMWTDVGGQTLDAAVGSYNAALPMIETGRGKAVGATGLQRLSALPNVPTMVEQGAQSKLYELRGFTGFLAPAGTPPDIIKKLSDTIVAGAHRPEGEGDPRHLQPEPADRFPGSAEGLTSSEQTPLWIQFMEGVGIKPE